MKQLFAILAIVACKGESKTSAPRSALGVVAEIRGEAKLVTGSRRFALRTGKSGWYTRDGKLLVAQPEIGAAVAQQESELGGLVDVFLGTTPIVGGGEDHHERHLRIAPEPNLVELDGVATEVATTSSREVWRYTHELSSGIAFVNGTSIEMPAPIERIGADVPGLSPVSERACKAASIRDVDASGDITYGLVVECNLDTPVRIVSYEGTKRRPDNKLPSPNHLGMAPEIVAAGKSGKLVVMGSDETRTQIIQLAGNVAERRIPGTRVVTAVVADDDRVWMLAFRDRHMHLTVEGEPVEVGEVQALGLDEYFGAIVLAIRDGKYVLLAERPPSKPIAIDGVIHEPR